MSATSNVAQGNVGIAFGLVIGSGMATALGASVVFFPSLVKLASRRVLASGLGFSAGVMTYVSFTEIMTKSVHAFQDEGMSDFAAHGYATICFFGGVACMVVIDFILRCFSKHHHHHHHHDDAGAVEGENPVDAAKPEETAELTKDPIPDDASEKSEASIHYCVGCMENPGGELEEWQRRAREEEEHAHQHSHRNLVECDHTEDDSASITKHNSDSETPVEPMKPKSIFKHKPKPAVTDEESAVEVVKGGDDDEVSDVSENQAGGEATQRHEDKRLIKMGLNTALAIGIHNFPEGLATFVSALADAKVGAVLAVAIGIHNIPEGLCVAMPIYYATGNRCKAFAWGVLSGLSEPVAALLGYLVLANVFNDIAYAVLFGITSGMMVIISIKELLPTAHRYDDQDTVVTYSFITGMFIMAISLVLFQI